MTDTDISICIQKFIEDKADIIQKNHEEKHNGCVPFVGSIPIATVCTRVAQRLAA